MLPKANKDLVDSIAAPLRNEAELLITCARSHVDRKSETRLRDLIDSGVDWTRLVQMARVNRVVPLIYATLTRIQPAGVPQQAMDELQRSSFENSRRNLRLTRELLRVLGELEALNVPVVTFKGPVLAMLAYGRLALREFSDLDILIKERDIDKAASSLNSLGYQLQIRERSRSKPEPTDVFLRSDGAVWVDLHWSLSRSYFPFQIERDGLWERAQTATLAHSSVLTPSREDLLLILCMHGSKHMWSRLGWVCDVAELIRSEPEFDWGLVMERAGRLGSRRMLFLGIDLAFDLLGAPVPGEVLRRARRDTVARSLCGRVLQRMFLSQEQHVGTLKEFTFHFKARERFRDRVPNVLTLAYRVVTPNERDRSILSLPGALARLYYLVRLIRVAAMYVASPIRRFGRGDRPG